MDVAALQVLVPAAAPLLDAVRGLPRVSLLEPPHISLGYPWRAADAVDLDRVRAAAAAVAPFEVRFPVLQRFPPDGRGRVLLHVVPDDDAPLQALARHAQADLRAPHLSVARVLPGAGAERALDAVVAQVAPLLPLVARVDVLELSVQEDGVWQPPQRYPLGGQEAGGPHRGSASRSVLVVDDDALVRLLLRTVLAAAGWEVDEAASVAEAEQALARAPAVVVLDDQLPDGAGSALAARVAARLPGSHVVLHTGTAPGTLPPGVDAVVPKGGPPEALLDHLAALTP